MPFPAHISTKVAQMMCSLSYTSTVITSLTSLSVRLLLVIKNLFLYVLALLQGASGSISTYAHTCVNYVHLNCPFLTQMAPFLPYLGVIFYLGILVCYLLQLTHLLRTKMTSMEGKLDAAIANSQRSEVDHAAKAVSNEDSFGMLSEKINRALILLDQQSNTLLEQQQLLAQQVYKQEILLEQQKDLLQKNQKQQRDEQQHSKEARQQLQTLMKEQASTLEALQRAHAALLRQHQETQAELAKLKNAIESQAK